METYLKKLQDRLCTEPECCTESFISYLFVQGYMTLDEYKKFLNSQYYLPNLQYLEDPKDDIINVRGDREEIVENIDRLKDLTLSIFD